ncbi:MAG TPA: acyl-CoA synthetase [Myxococcales bacterium]|nr:acyl-CoA synthetase [Myxococcales bacterium]
MNTPGTERRPRRLIVSIIGNGSLPPDDSRALLAKELGQALVDAGYRIACGGMGGVMAAVCEGAYNSASYRDGDIIGILPGFDPSHANPWVDLPIATGLDHVRNFIVANGDAVVAVGGGAGTLSEMAGAWQLNRLICAYRTQGWSGRLADQRIDERVRYDDIPEDRIFGVDSADQVIALLAQWLPRYCRRHTGIKEGTR